MQYCLFKPFFFPQVAVNLSNIKFGMIDKDITLASTPTGDFYLSEAQYSAIKELVFAKSWQMIGDENDYAENGYLYPVDFMKGCLDEPLLMSIDANGDAKSGLSYYWVESEIENKPLFSYKGEKGELKIGMTCAAQVITKRKKILYYLLEKINLKNF